MILGLHCSIRQSLERSLEEAAFHQLQAMQIFSYNRHRDPSPEELEKFRREWPQTTLSHVVVHARYLPALAASTEEKRQHSVRLLQKELRLTQALGVAALIVHAGAYFPDSNPEDGMKLFVRSVQEAYAGCDSPVRLILENVPGGGRRLGGTFAELAHMLRGVEDAGIAVAACLDSAHAYAQGYDIASEAGMARFVDEAITSLGQERLQFFHLNDTQAECRSHRENHAHWGEGKLGLEGIRFLVQDPRFAKAVGIIETPKNFAWDKKNLAMLRRLAS